MINYEKFLSFINQDKVEEAKKFEQYFYTMFRPGTLTVCTMGFLIEIKDLKNPEDKCWKDSQDIIRMFNPLHAWIGSIKNQRIFKKEYPNITVESYSFFEDSGFIPVVVIPTAML